MKNLRRIFSIILVLSMLLNMAIGVSATETNNNFSKDAVDTGELKTITIAYDKNFENVMAEVVCGYDSNDLVWRNFESVEIVPAPSDYLYMRVPNFSDQPMELIIEENRFVGVSDGECTIFEIPSEILIENKFYVWLVTDVLDNKISGTSGEQYCLDIYIASRPVLEKNTSTEPDETNPQTSGSCGENLTWEFNENTGTLIISGEGEMDDFLREGLLWKIEQPWNDANDGNGLEDNITKVIIESGVTRIGNYAFYGLNSLNEVVLPEGIIEIGKYAFGLCAIDQITLPNSLKEIEESAFYNCSDLIEIEIPKKIIDIKKSVFENCYELENIIFLGDIESIGDRAFYRCHNLQIDIPENIRQIGTEAFYGCLTLSHVNIPKYISKIKDSTFENCENLSTISIQEGLIEIEKDAFKGCSSLVQIELPNSLTFIGESAFNGCSLTYIEIPEKVTTISSNTFRSCPLKKIILPKKLEKIGGEAFAYCELQNIDIPYGVISIGVGAFRNCPLSEIIIPDSVVQMGGEGPYINGSVFEFCRSLKSVKLSQNLTSICYGMFSNCDSLVSIELPYYISSIGMYSFSNCSNLESIIIPKNVTKIDTYAFNGCTNLKDVYYEGTETDWNNINIGGSNNHLTNATIHYNTDIIEPPQNSEYKIGLVTDADEHSLTIDKIRYSITEPANAIVVFPDYIIDKTVIYRLNENQEIFFYSCVKQEYGILEEWIPENREIRIDGYIYTYENGLTDPYFISHLSDMIGKQIQFTYAYTDMDTFFRNCIIDFLPSETITGGIRSLDVLSDPWMVYLENDDKGYPVDMTIEGLQEKLLELQNKNAVLTLINGKITFAYTVEESTKVKTIFSPLSDMEFIWNNNSYSPNSLSGVYTISFDVSDDFIGDPSSLEKYYVELDKVKFELDNLDMLEIENKNETSSKQQLYVGDSQQYYVTIGIKNSNEPEEAKRFGTLTIEISGLLPEGILNRSTVQSITITNQNKLEDLSGKIEEKTMDEAKKVINGIDRILKSMALPPELNSYLNDEQIEALKVIIFSEIALAKTPEKTLTKYLSDKLVEEIMDKYLGDWKFSIDAENIVVPVNVIVETQKYGSILCSFSCEILNFKTDGSNENFATQGVISTKIKLLDRGNISYTYYGGILTEVNIKSFSEGIWNIISGQLEKSYNLVWGNDANKITDDITMAGINTLVNKASPYIFAKPVEIVLDQFYEKKLKGKFSSEMFKILCYPSKQVSIHCPVDLYIYDSNNKIVGSIIDNEVNIQKDDLLLWTEGDSKYVQIFNDEYRIVYIPTDNGTMNIEILEQANNEMDIRTIKYDNIPLIKGLEYFESISNEIVPETNTYNLFSSFDIIYPSSVVKNEPNYSEIIPVTDVTLDNHELSLTEGETAQLAAEVSPENATNKSILWSSSDSTVASVDENGLVTAVSVGTATITATSSADNSIKDSCVTTVDAKQVEPDDPEENPDNPDDGKDNPDDEENPGGSIDNPDDNPDVPDSGKDEPDNEENPGGTTNPPDDSESSGGNSGGSSGSSGGSSGGSHSSGGSGGHGGTPINVGGSEPEMPSNPSINGNTESDEQTAWDGVTVGLTGGALLLDTKTYTMAPGDLYDIKMTLVGASVSDMKIYSSRSGIASVQPVGDGKYRVTGLSDGVTYIMFEVYRNGIMVNHASVKVTVENGAIAHGESNRAASLF